MKKLSFSVIITLLAVVSIVGGALAEGTDLPGTGWFSGETIQNVSGATATVQIVAYPQTGTTTYVAASRTVNAGATTTFSPGDFTGMPAGFEGSAIVSADQDIRAVVNVTNRYNASSGLGDPDTVSPAAGQYQGVNAGATTINFALVKNDHFGKSTTFYIQNAGGAAATATATFMLPNATSGGTITAYTFTTPSIGPGQMAVISPSNARDASNNPPPAGNGIVGSLTVTSAQPLAGTVLEHKTVEAHATVLQATRAFTPADYSTTVYAPTNKNAFFNRFTGLQIQNVTGGAITVDVDYAGIGGTCIGNSYSDQKTGLAGGASHTFPSSVLPAGCLAAATVTATGNIVGVVNESYTTAFLTANPGRQQESTTYSTLSASTQTTKISVPVYKENSFAKGTGVSIQNVGGGTAHVTVVFSGPAGVFTSKVIDILPGAAFVITDARNKDALQLWGSNTPMTPAALSCGTSPTTGCGANGLMGLIITSDQPIVAIANESTYPFTAPAISQDKNNYEGFNLVP